MIQIVESPHCVERKQWRFPRSKKRRTRNKWTKREENVRYEPRAFQLVNEPNKIFCHPEFAAQLRRELAT